MESDIRILTCVKNVPSLEGGRLYIHHACPNLTTARRAGFEYTDQPQFQKRLDNGDTQVFLPPHQLGYLKSVTCLELVVNLSSTMLVAGDDRVVYSRLRKLRVKECILHPNLLGFITAVAPNMQELARSLLGKSYHDIFIKKHYRHRKDRATITDDHHHTETLHDQVDVFNPSRRKRFDLQTNRGQHDVNREYDIYGTIQIQDQTRRLVFLESCKPAIAITNNKQVDNLEKMSKVIVLCHHIKQLKINCNICIEKDGDNKVNVILT
ncbi:hypothetical protein K501DRAFT_275839 [Backusella circina FSU 941]|nr:hypothetical protein K501DRAFT_275839 [Backusella circina FSU 941]